MLDVLISFLVDAAHYWSLFALEFFSVCSWILSEFIGFWKFLVSHADDDCAPAWTLLSLSCYAIGTLRVLDIIIVLFPCWLINLCMTLILRCVTV